MSLYSKLFCFFLNKSSFIILIIFCINNQIAESMFDSLNLTCPSLSSSFFAKMRKRVTGIPPKFDWVVILKWN